MKAVLMAGGSGTRLRPLTCDLPKPMTPMLSRPMAEHIVNLLRNHGFDEITMTLYYLPHVIQNYFGDGSDFGVKIDYAVEEKMPLGTAGSVKAVADQLTDTFIVISGDSLTDMDLSAAIAYHKAKGSVATLVLKRVDNPLEFGVVIIDEQGRIRRFLEKPSSSEVFSDTINTGTYILEPRVLEYLEPEKELDFSKDLFPALLREGEPMYGFITDGYWEDVGNLQSYRQAHYDILEGKVRLEIPYPQREPGIWIGEGTEIHPTATVQAPSVIGNNCQIGAGAVVSAGSVIGDNVQVGANSTLKRPVTWNNVYIGEEVALRGCVLAKNTSVKRGSEVLEGAIVANDCVVGEKAIIKPNVKVWPNKTIETGAMVASSLIWGSAAQRTLFGTSGVKGLVNVEVSPEFAVRLGAAYGASLPPGSHVTVSRDGSPAARMINRALISGLMSVGVSVHNLENISIPISRYQIPTLSVRGGLHVRIHPDLADEMQIEFLDSDGLNIAKALEKKIEANFFKEDFRRVRMGDIGDIQFPSRVVEHYKGGFFKVFDSDVIAARKPKIVIDYAGSFVNVILPTLLGSLGADTVVLNAHLLPRYPTAEEKREMRNQLAHVVTALKAEFGVQIDAHGERLTLVDNKGRIIFDERLLATVAHLTFAARPGSSIGVPVTASSALERIAARHEGRIIRTKANARALMEIAKDRQVVFAGTEGRFILPALHPGFDAMIAVAKITEALCITGKSLDDVSSEIPEFYHFHEKIPCPWEQKGTVMRVLVEQTRDRKVDLLDGIKIYSGDAWVLALPDPVEPTVHLFADGTSIIETEELLQEYRGIIEALAAGRETGALTRVG
ncbi:MAG: mannose-1-phosphate guanyltransferase [Candidatus Sericytochromatia bacterium]|nr:mannose-1-phosphate guanyltransferase [Candidatus Tanganyikabacteria bacterium]